MRANFRESYATCRKIREEFFNKRKCLLDLELNEVSLEK